MKTRGILTFEGASGNIMEMVLSLKPSVWRQNLISTKLWRSSSMSSSIWVSPTAPNSIIIQPAWLSTSSRLEECLRSDRMTLMPSKSLYLLVHRNAATHLSYPPYNQCTVPRERSRVESVDLVDARYALLPGSDYPIILIILAIFTFHSPLSPTWECYDLTPSCI